MKRILIATTLILLIAMAITVSAGGEIFEIKWNATGVYEKVYPISMVSIPGGSFNAFYDFSNYHVASVTMKIPPFSKIVANSDGIYLIESASPSGAVTLVVYPKICVEVNGTYYCNWGSSERTFILQPSFLPVDIHEYINMCIVLYYQPTKSSNYPIIEVTVYDYYTQEKIYSATWTGASREVICGVPNIVLINLTYNGQWLGMYYLSTHPPLGGFPSQFMFIAYFIPLGLFIAFAIRNRLKEAGIGLLMFGVFFTPFIEALHMLGLGYLGSYGGLISVVSIVVGIAILWFAKRRGVW